MLVSMHQPAQNPPSPVSANFAGMLAALALPAVDDPGTEKTGRKGELSDDVVTLSYERALSAHARYKPQPFREHEDDRLHWPPEPPSQALENPMPLTTHATQGETDLRTASVTVRLSPAESASLHQRAAEAGLTVSAYLRSCTVEAETLRAQVKEALAELRNAGTRESKSHASKKTEKSATEKKWVARLLARMRSLFIGVVAR
jgi:hypothetical protein